MKRIRSTPPAHGTHQAVLLFALILLLPAQGIAVLTRAPVSRQPEPTMPLAVALDEIMPKPTIRPSARTVVKAKPAKKRAARPAPKKTKPSKLDVFGGLGAWVDVYDFGLDPAPAVRTMKNNGVRTLYIQTGRYNTKRAVAREVGPWLLAAHKAGIDVVGWYLPSYEDVARDVKRNVAVARYRYKGHRLDGLGIDIEFKGAVRDPSTWNARVRSHAAQVRAQVDDEVPVASIVLPPVDMAVAPSRWAGFPWRSLAKNTDALLLMGYWSNRSCPKVPLHCAYRYTVENVRRTRALAGRDIPVHVIGGIGDQITAKEMRAFARAARDVDAFGASLYDFRTTAPAYWPLLRTLRKL